MTAERIRVRAPRSHLDSLVAKGEARKLNTYMYFCECPGEIYRRLWVFDTAEIDGDSMFIAIYLDGRDLMDLTRFLNERARR